MMNKRIISIIALKEWRIASKDINTMMMIPRRTFMIQFLACFLISSSMVCCSGQADFPDVDSGSGRAVLVVQTR